MSKTLADLIGTPAPEIPASGRRPKGRPSRVTPPPASAPAPEPVAEPAPKKATFDREASDADLRAKIAKAEKAGNHAAVATLTRMLMQLHGLLEDKPAEGAGLTFVFRGIDPLAMLPEGKK
jgi:hypothetical protein